MKRNNTVKVVVVSDDRLVKTVTIPAIRGFESIRELQYYYDSKDSKLSVMVRTNGKVNNPDMIMDFARKSSQSPTKLIEVYIEPTKSRLFSRKSRKYHSQQYLM